MRIWCSDRLKQRRLPPPGYPGSGNRAGFMDSHGVLFVVYMQVMMQALAVRLPRDAVGKKSPDPHTEALPIGDSGFGVLPFWRGARSTERQAAGTEHVFPVSAGRGVRLQLQKGDFTCSGNRAMRRSRAGGRRCYGDRSGRPTKIIVLTDSTYSTAPAMRKPGREAPAPTTLVAARRQTARLVRKSVTRCTESIVAGVPPHEEPGQLPSEISHGQPPPVPVRLALASISWMRFS